MEILVLFFLSVVVMAIVGFFMALGQRDTIKELGKRITALEKELERIKTGVDAEAPIPVSVPVPASASSTIPSPPPEEPTRSSAAAQFADDDVLPEPKPPVDEYFDISASEQSKAAAPDIPPTEEDKAEAAAPAAHLFLHDEPEPVADNAEPSLSILPEAEVAAPEEAMATASTTAPDTGDTLAKSANWEARIGKRWLTWGGVMLLVASAGFLVKYAYDMGWIGPWTQVGIGAFFGCALCGLGDWQIRSRNMRPLGQGIIALGLTLVYLTCFGAFAFFKMQLVSQITALALLALTSLAGVLLSNRHRSMPICILSALGGYLAPILVSTGKPPPVDGLFSYTLLVNLGIITISILRTWPAMPLLAFGGTVAHFWGWYAKFYQPEQSVKVAVWAGIFHFTFLVLPALPLIRGFRATPWQWLLPVCNAATSVYVLWIHLADTHPLPLMLTLLATAAVHILIGAKNRNAVDGKTARGIYSTVGLGVLTLAPLAWFGVQATLICWLLFTVLLIELGCRLDFLPYRAFGYGNLLLAIAWTVAKLWTTTGRHGPFAEFLTLGLGSVDLDFVNRRYAGADALLALLFSTGGFWTRLLTPVGMGAAAAILQRWRGRHPVVFPPLIIALGVAAALFALAFITNDVGIWITLTHLPKTGFPGAEVDALLGRTLAPLWCLGAVGVAAAGYRFRNPIVCWLSLPFLGAAAYLATAMYFNPQLPVDSFFVNAAFAGKIFFALCSMFVLWTIGGKNGAVCAGATGYLLIAGLHSETWSWLRQEGPASRDWLWSLIWTGGALAYPAAGRLLKKPRLEECFWLPFVVSAIFTGLCLKESIEQTEALSLFFNLHYLAGAALLAALFVKASRPGNQRLATAIAAGWLLLTVTHFELQAWAEHLPLARVPALYHRYWASALNWNVGTVVFALLHWRYGTKALRIGAAAPAALALLHIALGFEIRTDLATLPQPFFNMIYANEMLVILALFVVCLSSGQLRVWLALLGGYALLVATHLEIGYWHGPWSQYAGRVVRTAWYTALWAAGALIYLGASIKYRRKRAYFSALRVLSVAVFCAGWQYTIKNYGDFTLFLNARFLTSLLTLATLFAACRIASAFNLEKSENGFIVFPARYRQYLYVFAGVAGFLLLSFECHRWCIATWGDGEEGRQLAKMSVSIAWGIYSIMLLVTGFATRIRGWRLAGLALFGATCLKLVILDLSNLEQIHRILAFLAVGLLLIAASYLYHKMEKRLVEKEIQ